PGPTWERPGASPAELDSERACPRSWSSAARAVVSERSATTLDELATGRAWRVCQALFTLHAIADEACAGTGVAGPDVPRDGHRFRARARELLARTGTLARISRQ